MVSVGSIKEGVPAADLKEPIEETKLKKLDVIARREAPPYQGIISKESRYQKVVPALAPRAGLEPATMRLTAAHSTIELPGNF